MEAGEAGGERGRPLQMEDLPIAEIVEEVRMGEFELPNGVRVRVAGWVAPESGLEVLTGPLSGRTERGGRVLVGFGKREKFGEIAAWQEMVGVWVGGDRRGEATVGLVVKPSEAAVWRVMTYSVRREEGGERRIGGEEECFGQTLVVGVRFKKELGMEAIAERVRRLHGLMREKRVVVAPGGYKSVAPLPKVVLGDAWQEVSRDLVGVMVAEIKIRR